MALQLFDSKPHFLDDQGNPLTNGQLSIYKIGAYPDYADVFYDKNLTIDAPNPCPLNDYPEQNLYFNQDVTVWVEKLIGYDDFNNPIKATIKIFDIISQSGSGGEEPQSIILENIAQLKALPTTDKLTVLVSGYYNAGDCPTGIYTFDDSSTATADDGLVILSTVTPAGRWLYKPESTLDIRRYGVFPSGSIAYTSRWRSAQTGAFNNGLTLVIPTGNYKLDGGGMYWSYAKLDVHKDVVFTTISGTYEWRLSNTESTFANTLAGTGVKIGIYWTKWEIAKPIPITIVSDINNLYNGQLEINILINDGVDRVITSNTDINFGYIYADRQAPIKLSRSGTGAVYARGIIGTGVMDTPTHLPVAFEILRASNLKRVSANYKAHIEYCSNFIVDEAITLPSGIQANCNITQESGGKITCSGNLDFTYSTNFNNLDKFWDVVGYVKYGDKPISISHFLPNSFGNYDSFIESYNQSNSTNNLDMQGRTALNSFNRSVNVSNGSFYDIESPTTSKVDKAVVTNCNCRQVKAFDAYISNSNIHSWFTSKLTIRDSTLYDAGDLVASNSVIVNVRNHEDSPSAYNLTSTGNTIIRDVFDVGTIRLNVGITTYLENVTIDNCKATRLIFDGTTTPLSSKVTICRNIQIKSTQIATTVDCVNSSTKYFAIDGHINIDIHTDKRSTEGFASTYVTSGTGTGRNADTSMIFAFNRGYNPDVILKAQYLLFSDPGLYTGVKVFSSYDGKITGNLTDVSPIKTPADWQNQDRIFISWKVYH